MGITKAILGSNFPTEAIMKIVKLINMCLNQNQLRVLPLTMSDVIDEINGALQLEEGKKQQQPETSNVQSHGSSKPGLYTSMEVIVMTNNFRKRIEKYGFETMYHGKLQNGQEVAVKVWELRSHSAAKEFHQFGLICCNSEKLCEHVVQMIGYYESETRQISIYEYMPGGTLQNRLFDIPPLDWKTRLKIALHIAQGLPYFLEQYFKLESKNIFLTENEVPKVTFQPCSFHRENSLIYEFGCLLWELISGWKQFQPREGLSLVEDFFNKGFIDSTLGSNFQVESIMTTIRIADFCLRRKWTQRRISDLINEMNGALQLEEGRNAEEGAMNIQIPQYASQSKTCASLETTLEKIKSQTIFAEKSTSDCDPKGKRPQQDQTSTTQSHGSRSSKGDSMCSSSDDEMPSTSKNESLSPQLELCAAITSIEGVQNLPTSRFPIMVACRKINEGGIMELLFRDAENMAEAVGVGLEWAKVVVTKELDVEVRQIGEHAWRDLWARQGCGEFQLMNIILPEPQTGDQGSTISVLENQTERFGVGLTKNDVIGVYVEDHLEQWNEERFSPFIHDLAEYMGLKGDSTIKSRQVSGGEGGSSKGAAKAGSSTQQSGGSKKDVHQDPSQDPPQDGSQDGSQRPPEPSSILPSNSEEKKVLAVSVFPLWGYVREGYGGQEIHEGHQLFEAAIVPVLNFLFEVMGDQKKITTTLNSQCNLGKGGGSNVNPRNLGYLQDNITISLNCKKDRAATLSSPRVADVENVKKTITSNISSLSRREYKAEIGVQWLVSAQAGGSQDGTTERGSSSALEISTTQLSSFHVNPRNRGGSLVYNFLYPEEVEACIADAQQGPRQLIALGIGGTFAPTIIGEWDALDESRRCKYRFKTQRDISSIESLRQSRGRDPECIQQRYKVPLWVNHAMTHVLCKHEIKVLRAPDVNSLKHVIGAKPAVQV
ncbi:hypothetical protein CY35_08G114700 [Sphagnum magellanicum]|nr:hypothetical protein CY35_08G114700 [Sphagnum magellanicum]KAH9555445.1 hypothetical protein CY35_08G114700 [Sphagnum magellanicum]KAH9555446.1 hypothetical protein CY35_08G114700 [Sphagnum magellanicum]KAH9555447.1 hypothetical protein CY35_08G114700 [Sphagnum magellanicum]KAH9555448.1 hypothetical protein CY35_08G114700 [Sphagnum magellanicum]